MGTYKTRMPDGTEIHVPEGALIEFARDIGLEDIASGRYSKLFVFKLLLYTQFQDIEMTFLLEEMRALEGLPNHAPPTKPPTQFTRPPLRGLWHKHFFDARFVPHNIAAHWQGGRLKEMVERVLDPTKYPVVTRELIRELSDTVVHGSLIERENRGGLTGEWIIFAKHQEQNYYLTLSIHTAGDQNIYDEIESMAYVEFPFLA